MARRTAPTFETRLRHALAAESSTDLLAVLGSRRKTHAGTPPLADIRLAAGMVAHHFAGRPTAAFRWALDFSVHKDTAARQLACLLLPDHWQVHPRPVERAIRRLADDEQWPVREMAGAALGELLSAHFDALHSRCRSWTRHPSANVRRAVCLAAMVAGKSCRPEWGDPLLDLLEPLLSDSAAPVRKNLGPFSLAAMLRWYPEQTLARLTEWAGRGDAPTRWNVAMVFSSASGADRWPEGLPLLAGLAIDKRRFVWRAVATALRVMRRRHPQEIVPQLKSWLEHPLRKRAAEVALRCIEA